MAFNIEYFRIICGIFVEIDSSYQNAVKAISNKSSKYDVGIIFKNEDTKNKFLTRLGNNLHIYPELLGIKFNITQGGRNYEIIDDQSVIGIVLQPHDRSGSNIFLKDIENIDFTIFN